VSGMGRNKNLIGANVCMEPDGVTWFQARRNPSGKESPAIA
jgi:hypothetical protein